MDPITLAPLLRDYGPWGLLATSLTALAWVVKQWKNCFEARVADGGKNAAALEKSSQTTAAVAAALESRSGHFERLGQKVDENGQRSDLAQQLMLAKLETMQRQIDDLRRGERS